MAPGTVGPYEPPSVPTGTINLTDPDSSVVPTRRGFMPGYTAQAVATSEQIVITADLICGGNERRTLQPLIEGTHAKLDRAGVSDPVTLSRHLADRRRERSTGLRRPPSSRGIRDSRGRRRSADRELADRRLGVDAGGIDAADQEDVVAGLQRAAVVVLRRLAGVEELEPLVADQRTLEASGALGGELEGAPVSLWVKVILGGG